MMTSIGAQYVSRTAAAPRHANQYSARYEVFVRYHTSGGRNVDGTYYASLAYGVTSLVAQALLTTGRTIEQGRRIGTDLLRLARANAEQAARGAANYAPEASAWFGAYTDADVPATITIRVL